MGIGSTHYPPVSADEWNSGSCDVMAVALHRAYGLPIMAEFETGTENGETVLGYLVHAWVRLPDGRAFDAAGPKPMFEPVTAADPNDPWVTGYAILDIRDDDPHLLDVREETDYRESISAMMATEWAREHLSPILADLGIEEIREGLSPEN